MLTSIYLFLLLLGAVLGVPKTSIKKYPHAEPSFQYFFFFVLVANAPSLRIHPDGGKYGLLRGSIEQNSDSVQRTRRIQETDALMHEPSVQLALTVKCCTFGNGACLTSSSRYAGILGEQEGTRLYVARHQTWVYG